MGTPWSTSGEEGGIRPGVYFSQEIRMGVTFVGIDPGWNGGAALLHPDGAAETCVCPETLEEMYGWLVSKVRKGGSFVAVLEQVGGYVGGSGGNIGSRMFTFGTAYGAAKMLLVHCQEEYGLEYRLAHPNTWQRKLGVKPKGRGESKASFKRRLKELAQSLFPGVAVTLKTADALLLAEYARVTYGAA